MAKKTSSFISYVNIFANEEGTHTFTSDGSNSNDSVTEWDMIDQEKLVDIGEEINFDYSDVRDEAEQVSDSNSQQPTEQNGVSMDHTMESTFQSPIIEQGKISGYLHIFSSGGRVILRQARKRWCMFDSNVCKLLYFRSPEDCAPLGEIDISMASFNLDAKKPTIFEIRSEGTVIHFEAASRKVAIEWVKGLQNSRRVYCRKKANQSFKQLFGRSVQEPEGGLLFEEKTRQRGDAAEAGISEKQPVNMLDAKAQVMREAEADITGDMAHGGIVTWKTELKSIFAVRKSKSLATGLHVSGGSETSDEEGKVGDKGASAMDKLRSFLDINVFQKAAPCCNCQQLQKRLLLSQKEKEGVEDELQALKEVKRVLQRELNIVQREKETMQYLGCGLHDSDVLALLQKKDKEAVTLASQLNQLEEDFFAVQADKKTMSSEMLRMRMQIAALEESLASCDDQRISLKYQVNGLEAEVESLKEALQRRRKSDSGTTELQTLKDLCRGYEMQNRVLNQEVMELQRLRVEEERDKSSLLMKCMQVEAEKSKTEMKYVHLLQDLQAEGHSSYSQETVCQLLRDAMDTPEGGEQTERKQTGQLYDRYGFAVKPWDRNSQELGGIFSNAVRHSADLNTGVEELPREISAMHRWETFFVVTGDRPLPRNQELKMLLRLGVPAQFKERVWKACVSFHTSHLPEKSDAGYYAHLLQGVTRNSLDPVHKQIELDLLRTLPHNRFYESVDSPGIAKLRNILLAYSARNPMLGYCQGLNRLAAIALLFLSEEDAFWCLVAIVERLMPVSYYQQSLADAHVDQRVLKDLVSIKLPRLHAHLEHHTVDLSMFTFGWFLTVFVDEAPVSTYLRIWDTFLFEGNKILFRFALAFLKEAEPDLLDLTDSLSIHCALRLVGQRMVNVNHVADVAFQGMNPFPMKTILHKRHIYRAQVMDELQKLHLLRRQASITPSPAPPSPPETYGMLSDED